MAEKYQIKSVFLFPLRQLCDDNPVDLLRVLAKYGLASKYLHMPDLYLEHNIFAQILTDLAAMKNDSLFGLKLAEKLGIENLGEVGVLVVKQQTLASLYPISQYLFKSQMRGARHSLNIKGKNAYHRVEFLLDSSICVRQNVLTALGSFHRGLSELLKDKWQPSHLYLRAQPFKDKSQLAEFFGCPVTLNADIDALEYPSSDLYRKHSHSIESSKRLNKEMALALRQFDDIERLVAEFIKHFMCLGDFNMEDIAQSLGVHSKELQICLRNKGCQYSQILQKIRQQEACHLLLYSDHSIAEIAMQLGYSEAAVFIRRFQKWTTMTPLQWRKLHQ